ncbi:MAG: hypothetical protein ACTS7E_04055 [Arsenophonus sp. NC-CH8-MAG3]
MSVTVMHLIKDAEKKEKFANQISTFK